MRDYLLQFIVVVMGILITFQGSAWIEKRQQHRQSREILEMVRTELQNNMEELEFCRDLGIRELDGMEFFARHMNDIGKAPRDSINMYISVLGSGHEFSYSSNALEVLKATPASINVIDKELLREIFYCYDRTGSLLKSVNYYYKQKYDIVGEFYFSLDRQTARMMQTGESGYMFIEKYFDNPPTANLVFNTQDNFGGRVSETGKLIDSYNGAMEAIDRYIRWKR